MRRPKLVEVEFFLLVALTVPVMVLGMAKAIGSLVGWQ